MANVLLLGYDLDQPSFRHRMQSLVAPLENAGLCVRTERFPSGRYGVRTWERRALLRWADVTVLHQIKLSGPEARLFALWATRRVFDVDDAIYVRKPRRLGEPADDSVWRRRKFAATCRGVDVVAAGNEVLAGVARACRRRNDARVAGRGAPRGAVPGAAPGAILPADGIRILPTSIDTAMYQPTTASPADAPTIAWIGSPENLLYLEMIRPALERLAVRHPTLEVRVICSKFPDWPGIRVERIPWSRAGEAAALAGAHIGIMPLTDDEWARGKCAFKLLQYMAAALPCVASPVGANTEAVVDGVNGFYAKDLGEWENNLERLIESPALRAKFGAAGLAHVEQRYALSTYRARYVELLGALAETRP